MRGRGVWPAAPGEPTKFAGPVEQHMAEGGGFEPPEGVNLQRFSRPPQSAALPSLRRPISWRHENGGASGTRTHVAAVQRRSSPAELWPREKSRAASPMPTAPRQGNLRKPAGNFEAASPVPTAPATMAALLFGFRTNQTVAAPVPATTGCYFQNGKHHVLWSLPVRKFSKLFLCVLVFPYFHRRHINPRPCLLWLVRTA